jgi:hypothetical protein
MRVLLVDDDDAYARAVTRWLVTAGCEVVYAANGQEALEILREAPVDSILTDLFMPEKEGLETITEARMTRPGVRIVAMSGGGSLGDGRTLLTVARALGASATLQKPFSRQQLLAALELPANG